MASASRMKLLLTTASRLNHLPQLRQQKPVYFARNYAAAASAKQKEEHGVATRPKVVLIPGDGVSPELMVVVQDVIRETGIPLDFEEHFLSEVHPKRSEKLSDVVSAIRHNNGVCMKGVIQSTFRTNSVETELNTLNMTLRRALDLFANVVHIRTLEGVRTRHKNLDFVIIREQTEGEYSAIEHETVPGVVECYKIMTRAKCLRIAKFAFDYATKHGRKKVTAVHKANIMKLGDGLFLRCCEEVAHLYPHVQLEQMIIDNCCMQLVARPQQFDVMVMPNLYGNIIDNLASGLVGGAGVVTGESVGADCVVFEQGSRHSFQEAIGRQIANPTALLLCTANMLRHLHLYDYSDALKKAVEKTIRDGKVKTRDLRGHATTHEFAIEVMKNYRFVPGATAPV